MIRTHLEDDLLHAELDLPLGVHHGVGGVQQDLLHVRQATDLLRQVPAIRIVSRPIWSLSLVPTFIRGLP